MYFTVRQVPFLVQVVKLPGVEEWCVENFIGDTQKVEFKHDELEKQHVRVTEYEKLPILIAIKGFWCENENKYYCRRIMPSRESDVCLALNKEHTSYITRIRKEAYYAKRNKREEEIFIGFELFAPAFLPSGKAPHTMNNHAMSYVKPVKGATFGDHPGLKNLLEKMKQS